MNLKNNICKTKLLGSIIIFFATLFIITGCKSSDFIDDGNGHKQYKNSNGEFVKDDWVELNNKHYYFDMNGFLVTNQWVQDEYYVNENGVMLSNYWYDDKNGNMYYLGDDGKYVKNAIKDIDNNLYAFDINGNMVKNAPYISEGIGYFFSNDGKADKKIKQGKKD